MKYGVTWSALEAPLIEWGGLTGNILDGGRQPWLWQKEIPQSSLIYSWPVNNHWDTNFPLEQGAIMKQQYSLNIHDSYDVVAANRFGMETQRPFIIVQTSSNLINNPIVSIDNERLVVSTIKKTGDNKAVLLRLRSISDKPELVKLSWPPRKPREVFECKADERVIEPFKNNIEIQPYGMTNLRLVF
jgi:alpha-mannosidase